MRVESDQIKTLLVLVGMAAIFIVSVWMPLSAKRQQLNDSMADLDQGILDDRSATDGLAALGEQINKLQLISELTDKQIPPQMQLASLIRQWSIELDTQQVIDQDIQTDSMIVGKDYCRNRMRINFHGSFMSVYRFLRHVESMKRVVRINKVDISGAPGAPGSPNQPDQPLRARIELDTFCTAATEGEQ